MSRKQSLIDVARQKLPQPYKPPAFNDALSDEQQGWLAELCQAYHTGELPSGANARSLAVLVSEEFGVKCSDQQMRRLLRKYRP